MSDQTATKGTAKNNPPKPRFALAVGVVGHKREFWTSKDTWKEGPSPEQRLQKVVVDVAAALATIKAAALQSLDDHGACFESEGPDDEKSQKGRKPKPPILTLVSALADGADTVAADAALLLGYKLDAPLPFPREEYEHDFKTTEAKAHYNGLLERLTREDRGRCLELPGRRKSATGSAAHDEIEVKRAYEAAGLTVLSQADIVLAVWDGKLSRGRGGTAEMVAEAARAGFPIVLVDANGLLPIEVRWRGLTATPAQIVAIDDLPRQPLDQCIARVVDELVRLPAAAEQRDGFGYWLEERHRGLNLCIAFPFLMAVLFARGFRWNDIAPSAPAGLAQGYVKDAAPIVAQGASEPIAALAEAYGWADGIAVHFAQVFRSAVVTNFFFAALAVMAALVSVFFLVADVGAPEEHAILSWHHLPVGIEIALIGFVVGITTIGRWRRWHHRWVEAREVAERLRGALPLWTLGVRPASFPGEEPTWTGWYTRALVRMQGLRAGTITQSIHTGERDVLLNLLAGQGSYNKTNAVRMHNAERRLEMAGMTLFVATAAVAIDHLLDSRVLVCMLDGLQSPNEIAIWLSAALPAFATATYGIRIIGDFDGTVQRNERTHRRIERLIEAIRQDPPDFALLRARASSAADVLLGDVQSWRLSAESRGLAIPG